MSQKEKGADVLLVVAPVVYETAGIFSLISTLLSKGRRRKFVSAFSVALVVYEKVTLVTKRRRLLTAFSVDPFNYEKGRFSQASPLLFLTVKCGDFSLLSPLLHLIMKRRRF